MIFARLKMGYRLLAVLSAVTFLLLTGCGSGPSDEVYLLKGNVLYRQKPLAKGTVAFFSDGRPVGSAPLSVDGSYEAHLPQGRYRVAISVTQEMPEGLSPMEQFEYLPKGSPPIPQHYADYESSGLSTRVEATDENVQDFVLQ